MSIIFMGFPLKDSIFIDNDFILHCNDLYVKKCIRILSDKAID